mmetsp:Transcript_38550/g.97810  ORF Transcript_38550/g.97810 Transcript_38550/m.97810 type:complete len:213 (+) Transcript_38550:138-776(+)
MHCGRPLRSIRRWHSWRECPGRTGQCWSCGLSTGGPRRGRLRCRPPTVPRAAAPGRTSTPKAGPSPSAAAPRPSGRWAPPRPRRQAAAAAARAGSPSRARRRRPRWAPGRSPRIGVATLRRAPRPRPQLPRRAAGRPPRRKPAATRTAGRSRASSGSATAKTTSRARRAGRWSGPSGASVPSSRHQAVSLPLRCWPLRLRLHHLLGQVPVHR